MVVLTETSRQIEEPVFNNVGVVGDEFHGVGGQACVNERLAPSGEQKIAQDRDGRPLVAFNKDLVWQLG